MNIQIRSNPNRFAKTWLFDPIGAPNIKQQQQRHEAFVALIRGQWQHSGCGGRAQKTRHAGRVEPQRNLGLMRRSGTLRILSAATAAHPATAAGIGIGIIIGIHDPLFRICSVEFNNVATAECALQCAQSGGTERIRDRVVQCRCAEGRDGGATRRRRYRLGRGRGRCRLRVRCWSRRIGIGGRGGMIGPWRCQPEDADERAITGFAKETKARKKRPTQKAHSDTSMLQDICVPSSRYLWAVGTSEQRGRHWQQ